MSGIEKMMSDAASRCTVDAAYTQNQPKRKTSRLDAVNQE